MTGIDEYVSIFFFRWHSVWQRWTRWSQPKQVDERCVCAIVWSEWNSTMTAKMLYNCLNSSRVDFFFIPLCLNSQTETLLRRTIFPFSLNYLNLFSISNFHFHITAFTMLNVGLLKFMFFFIAERLSYNILIVPFDISFRFVDTLLVYTEV